MKGKNGAGRATKRVWLVAMALGVLVAIAAGTTAALGAGHGKVRRGNPGTAAQWFTNQRLTKGVKSPVQYAKAEAAALTQAKTEQSAATRHSLAAGVAQPVWQPIGPAPLTQIPPDPVQSVSGRVTTIATSGTGATEKVFTGAAGGGVWSGTLNGTSTSWATHTDFGPSLSEGAVAVAPSSPSTVYAGTGEDDGGADAFYGNGLLVSIDGGTTWVSRNPGGAFTGQTISGVAVDPADANHLYISGSAGFTTSSDGGQTLTAPTTFTYAGGQASSNVSAIAVDPTNFATVFAAVPGVGIEKSINGGDSFTVLAGGCPPAPPSATRRSRSRRMASRSMPRFRHSPAEAPPACRCTRAPTAGSPGASSPSPT